MNTVIVPVDFSDTSLNAAKYAAQLMTGHYGVTMVLYHSYGKASEASKATDMLEELKADLMKDHIVKMEILAHEESDFVDGLEKAARHRKADLVIMGITGKSALAQVFFGSNTLKMAERKACPVLIVPQHAAFSPLKNVMLTSDFKDTVETTPSTHIKDFLNVFRPNLHIVNVNEDLYISLSERDENEKQEMRKMFADYNPEFYFMRLFDVDEAISLFADSRNIDLIIVIQKNNSFISKILKNSRTKTLSYQSRMPILVMHE
ncbi:MAG: universal stress protein [Chitinophagaceae bacterium]|nr:universal stress protein [Chitinophagaceae bacterium]